MINDVTPRNQYFASMGQTVFQFTFQTFLATDLQVYQRASGSTADDATDILTYVTDYSVTFNSAYFPTTGYITLVTPASANDIITIARAQPDERENYYIDGGPFTAAIVNADFDADVLMIQQNTMYNQVIGLHYNVNDIINYPIVDNVLPVLPANSFWVKNSTNTAIIAQSVFTAGTSLTALSMQITQANHGFTLGQVIMFNGTEWALALADDLADAAAIGMVSYVIDTNDFIMTTNGYVDDLPNTYTPGGVYYLSDVTPGLLTLTAPTMTGHVVKPLFNAVSTTSGYYNNYSAEGTSGGGGGVITDIVGTAPIDATTVGTTTTISLTGIIAPANGGTGVNNGTSTLTLGGDTAFSGAHTFTGTLTGNTAVTFPTSGTLATTANTVSSISGTANQIAASASTGAVTLSLPNAVVMPGTLTLNADPTTALQAATKQYVDSISAGLTFKTACYAATTANLNATFGNFGGVGDTLTNAGTQAVFTLDGTTPPLNSRILVKNETTAYQNGIYTVTNVGSVSTNWILTRATDYDTTAEIQPGDFILVDNGTTNVNTAWIQTATVVTMDVSSIVFSQFAPGAGAVMNVTASSPLASSGGMTPNITLNSAVPTNLGGTALTSFTANELFYASSSSVMAQLATANNSILATNGSGVPGLTQTMPTAVQLSVDNYDNGSGASSSTYLRGDGTWQPTTGAGSVVLLATYNISSNVSSIAFTSLPSSISYSKLVLVGQNIVLTGTDTIGIQYSTNNGSSYLSTSNYYTGGFNVVLGGGNGALTINGTSSAQFIAQTGAQNSNFTVDLYGMNVAAGILPSFFASGTFWAASAVNSEFSGIYSAVSLITANAFQLLLPTSQFTSGTFYLYGYAA